MDDRVAHHPRDRRTARRPGPRRLRQRPGPAARLRSAQQPRRRPRQATRCARPRAIQRTDLVGRSFATENVVAHHYHRIDTDLLWQTVAHDFVTLKELLDQISGSA
ncbi:MAG: HepT-like ribonuclease domain-containing protein [Microcella pacifica]